MFDNVCACRVHIRVFDESDAICLFFPSPVLPVRLDDELTREDDL